MSTNPTSERGRRAIGTVTCFVLKWLLLGPLLRVWLPGRISNIRVLDDLGGAVVASNHQSFVEHLLLPLHSRRPIRFWAKSDWWGSGLKGRLQGFFFTLTDQVPVDRSGGAAAEEAVRVAVELVRDGQLFGIYPEGTRSRDQRVYRGHTGAVRVAALGEVPIVPCAVVGTGRLQPKGRIIPKPGRFEMIFGEPMAVLPRPDDHDYLRRTTDELMRRIAQLGALEYADEFASRT